LKISFTTVKLLLIVRRVRTVASTVSLYLLAASAVLVSFSLAFHASSLGRAILDPGGSSNGANARRLSDIREIVDQNGIETELGDVGARNRARFALNDIDNASGRVDGKSAWTDNAIVESTLSDNVFLGVLVCESKESDVW
jgi:hypothetical protein